MKTSKLSKPSKQSKPASRFVAAVIVAVLLGTGFTAPAVWAGDPPPANPNDPLDRDTTVSRLPEKT